MGQRRLNKKKDKGSKKKPLEKGKRELMSSAKESQHGEML